MKRSTFILLLLLWAGICVSASYWVSSQGGDEVIPDIDVGTDAVLVVVNSEDKDQLSSDQLIFLTSVKFREYLNGRSIGYMKVEPEQVQLFNVDDHWQTLRDAFDEQGQTDPGWIVSVDGKVKFGDLPSVDAAIELMERM